VDQLDLFVLLLLPIVLLMVELFLISHGTFSKYPFRQQRNSNLPQKKHTQSGAENAVFLGVLRAAV